MHCCCLHVNYIVYKHFGKSLHVGSSDPTCVHIFRSVPLTVLEILGFKLKKKKKKKKKKDKKKNWRNGLFAISLMLMVQFKPNIWQTYILTLVIILQCQKWIMTENESVNWNFRMYRHGPRPRPSLYTKYYHTL